MRIQIPSEVIQCFFLIHMTFYFVRNYFGLLYFLSDPHVHVITVAGVMTFYFVRNYFGLLYFLSDPHVHVITVAGASLHAGVAADQYNRHPIANNGLIIANSENKIRLLCASNSSQNNVGLITGQNGNTLTALNSGWTVNRGTFPGFIGATKSNMTADDQGIYRCNISDSKGNIMVFNVGLLHSVVSL